MGKEVAKGSKGKGIEVIGTPLENGQHEAFCRAYAINLSKVDSYLQAYQTDTKKIEYHSAASSAGRLMKDAGVQNRIRELADHTAKGVQVSKYRILEDLQNEIDTNPFDCLEWTKEGGLLLKNVDEIPPHVRKCIKGIKENKEGRIELTFYDKQKAREMLMKYSGMLTERVDLNVTHDIGETLAAAHQRVIKRASSGIEAPEGIEDVPYDEL